MKRLVKIVVGLVAAVAIVYVLFTQVFPWVDRNLTSDPTLGSAPVPLLTVA